jgi:hypothetical protein
MAVITITITASTEEIVSGIPYLVSISTNIPSSIFYTLDGSTPTTMSTIYTNPIILPVANLTVVLNVFATNGVDSSPVITETYQTDNTTCQDARVPHSATNARPEHPIGTLNPAPFGAPPLQPNQQFIGAAAAGLTVDNPLLPQVPGGFDGSGNETGFTNGQDPYGIPSKNFPYIYSTNERDGAGSIGTFPPHTVVRPVPPAEQSNMNSPFFDPRALVVIQDLTQPQNPLTPITINRMNFSLEDVNHTRTGNQYYNSGLDAPPITGGLTRPQFNPVDNTMTYSYFDSTQNRWLFSKVPASSVIRPGVINDYSSAMVFGGAGVGNSRCVYQWVPFKGQNL